MKETHCEMVSLSEVAQQMPMPEAEETRVPCRVLTRRTEGASTPSQQPSRPGLEVVREVVDRVAP